MPWECVLWASWTGAARRAMWPVRLVRIGHCTCSVRSISLSPSSLEIERRKHGKQSFFTLTAAFDWWIRWLTGTLKQLRVHYTRTPNFIKNDNKNDIKIISWTHLTGGADSECCQSPAESQHASVQRAESVQTVLDQLAQRLGKDVEALLQLRHRVRKCWMFLKRKLKTYLL